MASPATFSIPPVLTGQFPLLLEFSSAQFARGGTVLNLDASLVKEVDAVGAVLFFLNFSKALRQSGKKVCKLILHDASIESISLKDLRLLDLAKFVGIPIADNEDEPQSEIFTSPSQRIPTNINTLPVGWYSLNGDALDAVLLIPELGQAIPRHEIITRTRSSLDILFNIFEGTVVTSEQLMLMFSEMVKNSMDHSGSRSAFGIHVAGINKPDSLLTFALCDQGVGVVATVRPYLKESKDPLDRNLAGHGAFTDVYKWAFEHGKTTKPNNGTNQGMGMGIIREIANSTSADIYLLDAESLLHVSSLPDNNAHSMMRRAVFPMARSHCFGYFGEIRLNK